MRHGWARHEVREGGRLVLAAGTGRDAHPVSRWSSQPSSSFIGGMQLMMLLKLRLVYASAFPTAKSLVAQRDSPPAYPLLDGILLLT